MTDIEKLPDQIVIMSESIGAISGALAKAQADIANAIKGAENPFLKSKYADLASIWASCQNVLPKNEIAVTQFMKPNGKSFSLLTMISHSSGEWIRGEMPVPESVEEDKQKSGTTEIQRYGSAITYMRRYCLAAMVGVAPEDEDLDDDGQHNRRLFKTARERTALYNECLEDIQACETEDAIEECKEIHRLDLRRLWKSDPQIGQDLLGKIEDQIKHIRHKAEFDMPDVHKG